MNPYQSPSDEASKPVPPQTAIVCVRGYLKVVKCDADGQPIIPRKSWADWVDEITLCFMGWFG